jgi:sulfite dehydrogenase
MTPLQRRDFLKFAATTAGLSAVGFFPHVSWAQSQGRVVVIGGGYGGATAARYIKRWGGKKVSVTLIERNKNFISCPLSNLVLGGSTTLTNLTRNYDKLAKIPVRMIYNEAKAIDPAKRTVKLASGETIPYDRLVVSPGIEFMWEELPALSKPAAQEQILHAWKAGPQTVALRKQLEAMPDGGVYALSVPLAPYRCPPGPYERACQVASYFKQAKPKSKVLVLDANDKIVSKTALFEKIFKDVYGGIIEYRPNSKLVDVDVATKTAKLEVEDVRADVLNVVPPHRAADIAQQAGLITANKRWCEVNWLTMESKAQQYIHVLGDATQSAPLMPKSGHMANQHAKLAAAAILNLLSGQEPNPTPVVVNTCYSFVDAKQVIHVASVHQYNAEKKLLEVVQGSGGVSKEPNEQEGRYAWSWARNIWADMLG